MDVLTDDHEREQVVRKWWHENWLSLTVGIVIAIALMIGYKQYQVYKNDKAAANAYEMSQIQTALVLKPTESIEKAQAFIKEHEDIYGSLLSLDLASTYIAQKAYDKALDSANFASKNGGKLVAPNASLMAAHILTEQKKYDEAIKIVNGIESKAYEVEKQELLGDIYVAKNDLDKAHDAYAKALDACEAQKIAINSLLQMKADSLIKDGDKTAFSRAQKLQEQINASATQVKK